MNKNDLISEWLEKAGQDYTAASHMIHEVHPELTEISCYHSQQCAEKSLKAFLIYQDIEPPYTHDLAKLCLLCEDFDDSFSSVAQDCVDLTQYAISTRYPNETVIALNEAEVVLNKAANVLGFINNKIPGLDTEEEPEESADTEGEETAPEMEQ